MSVLKNALKEEQERLRAMLDSYNKEIKSLPKGSIQYKKINGKKYPYLTFRQDDNSKVCTVYVKKNDLDQVVRNLEKRKKLLQYIKDIENDLEVIRKSGVNK